MKKNPKKYQHFGHFFIEESTCEVQLPCFIQDPKIDFNEFECLYLAIHVVEISEFFTTCSQATILTRSYGYMCQKKFQIFSTCIRNDSFEAFWMKT